MLFLIDIYFSFKRHHQYPPPPQSTPCSRGYYRLSITGVTDINLDNANVEMAHTTSPVEISYQVFFTEVKFSVVRVWCGQPNPLAREDLVVLETSAAAKRWYAILPSTGLPVSFSGVSHRH